MGILDKFERSLERTLNGAFAKTFRSGLQPVEIVSALRREMDTHAQVVSRTRILVPNRFHVHVSPGDYDRLASQGQLLIDELLRAVEAHALSQSYQFVGGLSIKLLANEELPEGRCEIDSRSVQGRVAWSPVLDIDGERHRLRVGTTIIGRASDATIVISDSAASRHHCEIVWDGKHASIRDLGSTNGTKLQGRRVSRASLEPDSTLTIGSLDLTFRVIPESAPEDDTTAIRRPNGGRQ